ncbi:hypothetical protein L248_2817 [Schleiferilactobacillus shenzhenensis LY-73]|uniref:AMP-dependent synthetase/ligase domain-containing protein n=1 Tax=Schleiferilactobacillus shenzhenensis LY-73 TaxID=1231336 RepID=U4TU72_9LACO|nr:hypothetical protein L248_2817 [Schleiferilactobacillus shenzhenensis LY-73]
MIAEKRITHLSLSPSFAEALLDIAGPHVFDQLHYLLVAGEAFPVSLVQKLAAALAAGCHVFNVYGPTETTIYATHYAVTGQERTAVPIGVPFHGAVVKLVDKTGHTVRDKGELYIGGKGVTLGYLLDEVKNHEKFVTQDGERYYQSGDDVSVDAGGQIVFLGRQDDQVQVNGIRVELGEIESIVASLPEIVSVKVKYRGKRIYLFYIGRADQHRAILNKLPEYLNPIIIRADSFLYTYNRKFDTNAMIAQYQGTDSTVGNESVYAQLKQILAKYQVTQVSDLDSLDTVRFFLDVETAFSTAIDDARVFELDTLAKLTHYIEHPEVAMPNDIQPNALISEKINLRTLIKSRQYQYSADVVAASSSQQSLFLKGKKALYRVSIALPEVTQDVVDAIDTTIRQLMSRIDILNLAWFIKDERLAFKTITNNQPIVFVTQHGMDDQDIEKVFYETEGLPIFACLLNVSAKQLDFVFTHHTIDASSATMFQGLFWKLYRGDLTLAQVPESSFAGFMKLVKEANETTNLEDVVDKIPQTSVDLHLHKIDTKLYIAQFHTSQRDTDSITALAAYIVAKAVIQDREVPSITGKLALNIRHFADFDASNVIGDVHATVPFEVRDTDDYGTFMTRYKQWVAFNQTGVDVRYCLFNTVGAHQEALPRVAERWNAMNISLNYIGEVKDPDSEIREIQQLPFKENYITVFSHQGTISCILYGDLFRQADYSICHTSDTTDLTVNELTWEG